MGGVVLLRLLRRSGASGCGVHLQAGYFVRICSAFDKHATLDSHVSTCKPYNGLKDCFLSKHPNKQNISTTNCIDADSNGSGYKPGR